jgi:hypothetical protein
MLLTKDNSRDRILKAVKERVKVSNERERIRIISNIIGDRRDRDLVDIIATIEQDEGWSVALEYLLKARNEKYSSPMTMGAKETNLEDLKYREVVFGLLSCNGLEPVPGDTTTLLKELISERSLIDASSKLVSKLEKLAVDQIRKGDTLFFDFSDNISISQETVDLLQTIRSKEIQGISIEQDGPNINIDALWYCEYGRLTLTNLGIKDTQIDSDTFDRVLSILQEPIDPAEGMITSSLNNEALHSRPSNKEYRILLTQIIHQDIDGLCNLASRHALPTLSSLLDEATSHYKASPSTTGFKKILHYINAHIAVRALDSVITLEKTSQVTDPRIATLAILALGNFYNESAASTLVDILCNNKNREIIETTTRSIETIYKRCPEADHVISDRLDKDCTNRGKLIKLQRHIRKKRRLYYQ